MTKVDLHVHSNASDGRLSPAEVVRKAVAKGMKVIALTDHDTIDGIPLALEAAKTSPGLTIIPGVELSSDVETGEVHVLGYFIDFTYPELLAFLERMRNSRLDRAKRMIARLKELGITIEWERVKEIAGTGSLGRPHIAEAILEKGYISSIKEAFDKYIGWGCPAYVEREKITPVEAVELILRANGLPVLAHPFTVNNVEATVVELKAAGLVGMEVYYDGDTSEIRVKLANLAKRYSLLACGGSDFHGLDIGAETDIGDANVPEEAVERLIALAMKRGLKIIGQQT